MNILSYVASDQYVQIAFLLVAGALLALLIISRNIKAAHRAKMDERAAEHSAAVEKRNWDYEHRIIEGKAVVVSQNQGN